MKKVLILSVPSWNKKSGSDTFSSLMEGYGADNVANIYIRETLPDSPVCNNYFRISENAVLKSIVKRSLKTGKRVYREQQNDNEINERITEERYKKLSSKKNFVLSIARELVWKFGRWKTKELKAFIDEFKPDVVFFAMEGYIHLNRISRYAIKKSGAKGIGYFWDDNFTYKQSNKLGYKIYRYFQRKSIKKTVKLCSDFFAIAPKTKAEADKQFGIDCKILTKPIKNETVAFQPYTVNEPIKMLYTGKLIIGRFDTVKFIGEALNEINKNGVRAELDVYTTTHLSEEQLNSVGKYVNILGAIPQDEVKDKQERADILLFAEAVEGNSSKVARLSFSTKLTDYFSSGKCIFAVGNPETAPMEYLKTEDAAISASSKEEIISALSEIIGNKEIIYEYAKKAYDCGKRNHNSEKIKSLLFDTINS